MKSYKMWLLSPLKPHLVTASPFSDSLAFFQLLEKQPSKFPPSAGTLYKLFSMLELSRTVLLYRMAKEGLSDEVRFE